MGFTNFFKLIKIIVSFFPPIVTTIILIGLVLLILLAVKRIFVS